jgi:hypothetical protein
VKFRPEHQEFRNPKVFYPDPKSVDLDRVLINFFLLLRCDGYRPASKGRAKAGVEKVDYHLGQLLQMGGVKGFDEHREVAKAWLESDVFDLVNRGSARESVASLRPLHLDAHKIRIAKVCRDYNVADALYALLEFGQPQALQDLKRYLDQGRDPGTSKYDGSEGLDLETLTVLKLVEGLPTLHPSGEKAAPERPTCIGQARVLCDDVQRLLAYQEVVPRPVMIDYLKTVFGLHVGLYTLRLSRQLAGWIEDKQSHLTCRNCPVHGAKDTPFEGCPYQQTFIVDMGGDYRSRTAHLAQESAATEYARLAALTKSLFTINQLLRYAREEKSLGIAPDPFEVPALLALNSPQFDADFRAKLKQVRSENEREDEELTPEEHAIFDADLPPFETFIELVTHVRQAHHVRYLREMLDKLFQKNGDAGVLVQGRSQANPRRWKLGGRLLEVFVQIAVLRWSDEQGKKRFYTEPMLVDDFVRWMKDRYGFSVAVLRSAGAALDDHKAFRDNVRAMKDRLREIGFYDDMSDAYNAQTIRPRYAVDERKTTTAAAEAAL